MHNRPYLSDLSDAAGRAVLQKVEAASREDLMKWIDENANDLIARLASRELTARDRRA